MCIVEMRLMVFEFLMKSSLCFATKRFIAIVSALFIFMVFVSIFGWLSKILKFFVMWLIFIFFVMVLNGFFKCFFFVFFFVYMTSRETRLNNSFFCGFVRKSLIDGFCFFSVIFIFVSVFLVLYVYIKVLSLVLILENIFIFVSSACARKFVKFLNWFVKYFLFMLLCVCVCLVLCLVILIKCLWFVIDIGCMCFIWVLYVSTSVDFFFAASFGMATKYFIFIVLYIMVSDIFVFFVVFLVYNFFCCSVLLVKVFLMIRRVTRFFIELSGLRNLYLM